MENIVENSENQADLTVKVIDNHAIPSCNTVKESKIPSIGNRQWPAPILWATSTDSRPEMRKQAQILAHSLIWRLMENCNQLKLGLSVLNHNVTEKKQGLKAPEGHYFHSKVNIPEISVKSTFKRQLQEEDARKY